jgi:hypothetical protein
MGFPFLKLPALYRSSPLATTVVLPERRVFPSWQYTSRISQSFQITSLFMIEVILSADGRVPRGRKNMTEHDKT